MALRTDRVPLARLAGGLMPGAPGSLIKLSNFHPYDVGSAKTLLAQIGLKLGSDGTLQWPSRPMAGQPVVIQLLASQDAKETQSIAELLDPPVRQVVPKSI
jgi:hypothetical protein